jgi:outer membrane lipoprotein LolB
VIRGRLALVTIAALIGVAACKPLTRPSQPGPWVERKAELQSANLWRFEGRVAIAGVESGGSAGIRWRQADTRSDISVFGALGAGGLTIELVGDRLHVETSGGEAVDDDAAVRVIANHLGVPLPLAELRYWLLGVTAPGSEATEVLGANQRLSALTQEGWEVHFTEYQAVAGDLLPARVDARREQIRVRLRITHWQWH